MIEQRRAESLWENFNNNFRDIPEMTVTEMVADAMKRFAGQTAVCDASDTLTFEELDRISGEVANRIREQGVPAGGHVAVEAEKTVWTVANIIGVFKAGCVYVPINPDLPQARKEYLLTTSACAALLRPERIQAARCREYLQDGACPDPASLAYIIFTSGSTGLPKGVMISHKSASNTVQSVCDEFGVGSRSRILCVSSFGFDLSVFDILAMLAKGACLVLSKDARDVRQIRGQLMGQGITLWNSVPSILHMVLAGCPDDWVCPSMKTVLLSGDWIPKELIPRVQKRFPNAEIVSLGGATEASIWSIFYRVGAVDPSWKSIPYGVPLPNQSIYVLRADQSLADPDEEGEIYIGGVGVGMGYINNKEKTDEAFVCRGTLGRLYRTGDNGVYREAGYVEFLGRADDQVKLNGYRIELGEIEEQAKSHPAIRDAAAVLIDRKGGKQIGLCYCMREDVRVSQEELRGHLRAQLPAYMAPSVFLERTELILNENHKVDRKAMSRLFAEMAAERKGEECRTETEREIAAIWQEVLGVREIYRDSDFFELGGNSLAAMRILEQMRKQGLVPEELTIQSIIAQATVREVAEEAERVQQQIEESRAYYEEGTI
ncbi:MAG: non-ribosomal peptide synthetase [Clostridiales Family XIII bacterium]|jgi:amino acid adenylation domain-containing protein|nr:non-ribosomal peptide synthetase [Clostridiales Family XIII bacterium]